MSTTEEWRPLARYDGWYDVSSYGRVRSWRVSGNGFRGRLSEPRIKKPTPTGPYGYLRLVLGVPGSKGRTEYVHGLVAECWRGPRPDGHQAAHKDGDNTNNVPPNVRWATPLENENDKWGHGTQWRRYGNVKSDSRGTGAEALRRRRTRLAA